MRRRILIPLLAGDLLALFIGFAGAARIVFDAWAPWHAPLHGEDSIWSLLGLMVTGLFVGSYVSVRMGGITTRRPTYGRAVVIVVVAVCDDDRDRRDPRVLVAHLSWLDCRRVASWVTVAAVRVAETQVGGTSGDGHRR